MAELSILVVDAAAMTTLHKQWMDLDGPTDVMAFPMDTLDDKPGLEADPGPALLGDVILCPEVAADAGRGGRAQHRRRAVPADHARRAAPAGLRPRRARGRAGDVRAADPSWSPTGPRRTGRGPIRTPLPGTAAEKREPETPTPMTGPDVVLLVAAILLVPTAGALAAVDAALARVSVARVEELVREGRAGRRSLAKVLADRARHTNLLLLLRVAAELTATVFVTVVATSHLGPRLVRWCCCTIVVMVVVTYVLIGVGPRTTRPPARLPGGPARRRSGAAAGPGLRPAGLAADPARQRDHPRHAVTATARSPPRSRSASWSTWPSPAGWSSAASGR